MNWRKAFSLLFFLTLASALAFAHPAQAAQLTVEVRTDRAEYQTGELVTITARVLLDGQPVAARIETAYIDITYDSGSTFRNYITWDFVPVAPGVFVAQAQAGSGGIRQVYVAASATIGSGCCCCQTVCGSGVAYFTVKPSCTCQPCCGQPCCSCWCYQPCVQCRLPDFFVRYAITVVPYDPPVSFSLPDYVVAQLLQRANPVTFREAPAHSVIWSSVPWFGWVNDGLSELGLALDSQTGRISGNVDFRWVRKDRYFFFIEALNPAGEVIAGIWIELAFVEG